jgi:hypothetical protein
MAIGRFGHRGIAAAFAEARESRRPRRRSRAQLKSSEPGAAAEIEADGRCRGKVAPWTP